MEHELAGEIWQTHEYDVFKMFKGNRPVNKVKVQRILESFQERQYFAVPIVVNQEMEVLEGQHRFQASKEGGLPVYYTKLEADVDSTQVIRQLNADQTPYTFVNHLELYVNEGRTEYVYFQSLYDKYNELIKQSGLFPNKETYILQASSMLMLFCSREETETIALQKHGNRPWGRGNPTLSRMFKLGAMKVTDEKRARETLDYFLKVVSRLPHQEVESAQRTGFDKMQYKHLTNREFIVTLHYLLHYRGQHAGEAEKFNPDTFLSQLERNPGNLLKEKVGAIEKWTDWLPVIEETYNHKAEVRAYFCRPAYDA